MNHLNYEFNASQGDVAEVTLVPKQALYIN